MRKQSDIKERTESRTDGQPISHRILSDQRGLSTVEYAVLFVVIVVAGICAWKSLGDSVDTSVRKGQDQLSKVLESAASASAETLSNQDGFSSGSNAVNGTGRRSSPRGGGSSEATTHRASGSSSSGSAQRGATSSAVGVSTTGTATSTTSASNAGAADSTQASRGATSSSTSPSGSSSRTGRSSASSTAEASADAAEPSLWERAKSFLTESSVVETIAKEAAMMAAESVVPGLATFNAARTLVDDDASMLDKTFAAVQLATSIVPPVAAGVKTIGKVTKVGIATYKTAKAGRKVAKVTGGVVDDVVKAAAHTGSKYGDDVSGVVKRMSSESSIRPSSGASLGGSVVKPVKTNTAAKASVEGVNTPHTISGSRPPGGGKKSTPNSIYEQRRADGSKSVTYYDEKGRRFSREDYGQKSPHGDLPQSTEGRTVPHEHRYNYGEKGPMGKQYREIDQNGKPVGPWKAD